MLCTQMQQLASMGHSLQSTDRANIRIEGKRDVYDTREGRQGARGLRACISGFLSSEVRKPP